MNIACHIRNDSFFSQIEPALAKAGFDCERFDSDATFLRTVRRRDYDFILVEIDVQSQVRDNIFSWLSCRTGESTPVLVLSPVSSAELAAEALYSGADDFVATPVAPLELTARIHAILRRSNRRQTRRIIELAGFVLDRESSALSYQGTPIELTPREFTMAWLLFSTPGEFIARDTISVAIWGTGSEIAGRTIEQHVYKLRKKLQLGPERDVMIRTAYNKGYRLELIMSPSKQG